MDYQIGTKYLKRQKVPLLCTITDVHKTYNHAGELVKTSYVSTHEFCGQVVTESDVCATTVAIGMHLLQTKGKP